jgi:hypothetical protein
MKKIILISMLMFISILAVNVVSASDGLTWQEQYCRATALNSGAYDFSFYTPMGVNT